MTSKTTRWNIKDNFFQQRGKNCQAKFRMIPSGYFTYLFQAFYCNLQMRGVEATLLQLDPTAKESFK